MFQLQNLYLGFQKFSEKLKFVKTQAQSCHGHMKKKLFWKEKNRQWYSFGWRENERMVQVLYTGYEVSNSIARCKNNQWGSKILSTLLYELNQADVWGGFNDLMYRKHSITYLQGLNRVIMYKSRPQILSGLQHHIGMAQIHIQLVHFVECFLQGHIKICC